jgi:hypothetical protein
MLWLKDCFANDDDDYCYIACVYSIRLSVYVREHGPKVSYLASKVYAKIWYKFLYYLLNLQKFYNIRASMFNAKLTTLWHRSINWLVRWNPNVPVNMREYFRLTDFWVTLYIAYSRLSTVILVIVQTVHRKALWISHPQVLSHILTNCLSRILS